MAMTRKQLNKALAAADRIFVYCNLFCDDAGNTCDGEYFQVSRAAFTRGLDASRGDASFYSAELRDGDLFIN